MAKGAGERAAAIGLHHRRQDPVKELVHESSEIWRRNLVEVAPSRQHSAAHHLRFAEAVNETVDWSALHLFPIDAGLYSARNESGERFLPFEVGVEVYLGISPDELLPRLGFERDVRAAHDANRIRRDLPRHAEEFQSQIEIPGIVAETQDVGWLFGQRLFQIGDVFKQADVDLVAKALLGISRDESNVKRKGVCRKGKGGVC